MALAKKHNEGLIFENRAGITVNDILPDDNANEAFNKIDRSLTGVDWEAEPPEQEIKKAAVQIRHIKNNQYTALADDEDDDKNEDEQENDTKSAEEENDSEITVVHHDNKSTVVDSGNEITGIKVE